MGEKAGDNNIEDLPWPPRLTRHRWSKYYLCGLLLMFNANFRCGKKVLKRNQIHLMYIYIGEVCRNTVPESDSNQNYQTWLHWSTKHQFPICVESTMVAKAGNYFYRHFRGQFCGKLRQCKCTSREFFPLKLFYATSNTCI